MDSIFDSLQEKKRKITESGTSIRNLYEKKGLSYDDFIQTGRYLTNRFETNQEIEEQNKQISSLGERLSKAEDPAKGFTPLGIFASPQQAYRNIFKRGEKDEQYRNEIAENNRLLQEAIKNKKVSSNPDKYDVIIEALQNKNELLVEASGGDLKNKSTKQLWGQAFATAVDLTPLGAGFTSIGRQILGSGGKALAKSLLKEGAAFGLISGGATVLERDLKGWDAINEVSKSIIAGSLLNLGVGSVSNKIAEKTQSFLDGKKVSFTPEEKAFIRNKAPEITDDLFENDGVASPLRKTEQDVLAESIAEIKDPKKIEPLISDIVPKKERATVAKILSKTTEIEDTFNILETYNPERIKQNFIEELSLADTDAKRAELLKGKVPDKQVPALAKALAKIEKETTIAKILDGFDVKMFPDETPTIKTTPEAQKATIEPPKVADEVNVPKKEAPVVEAKKEGSLIQEAGKIDVPITKKAEGLLMNPTNTNVNKGIRIDVDGVPFIQKNDGYARYLYTFDNNTKDWVKIRERLDNTNFSPEKLQLIAKKIKNGLEEDMMTLKKVSPLKQTSKIAKTESWKEVKPVAPTIKKGDRGKTANLKSSYYSSNGEMINWSNVDKAWNVSDKNYKWLGSYKSLEEAKQSIPQSKQSQTKQPPKPKPEPKETPKVEPKKVGSFQQALLRGTGKERVRGVSKSLYDKSVSEGFKDLDPDLPTYKQYTRKEDIAVYSRMLQRDPERVARIAQGLERPVDGMTPEGALIAISNTSHLRKNIDLEKDLVHSNFLAEEGTTMGQRNSMWAELNENSFLSVAKEVLSKRSGGAKKIKKQEKQIREALAFKIEDAQDILNNLTCKRSSRI